MARGRWWIVAGCLAALAAVVTGARLVQQGFGDASVLSSGPRGWRAARLYLEAKGVPVLLLDHDLDDEDLHGVVVLAFPWQRFEGPELLDALDRHLRRGGDVVFGYSGAQWDAEEERVAERLGLMLEKRREPSLLPWGGRRLAGVAWGLRPGPEARAGAEIRVAATPRAPLPRGGTTILATDPAGRPAVFVQRRRRGRVVVVPAEAFANCRIGNAGNAWLLERLRQELGGAWSFDEFHHGLRAARVETGRPESGRLFLAWLLQLAVVYLLVLWAVSRRLGPPWREPVVAAGSPSAFLVGLGALHRRLGHQPQAAQLLTARACEWDPRLELDETPFSEGDLLALARRVGEAQSRSRRV
jgi:hypothetical protein